MGGQLDSETGISAALRHLIAVGTSAGGARAKAVVAINPATNEIRSGQVPADPGFEQWIVKLDGVGDDLGLGPSGGYGRIEYAYHLMARAAGIEMMECRLLEESGRAHFMTRRYDRPPRGGKVHCQTLCALGHLDFRQIGAHDYAQLFDIIDRLGLGPERAPRRSGAWCSTSRRPTATTTPRTIPSSSPKAGRGPSRPPTT